MTTTRSTVSDGGRAPVIGPARVLKRVCDYLGATDQIIDAVLQRADRTRGGRP